MFIFRQLGPHAAVNAVAEAGHIGGCRFCVGGIGGGGRRGDGGEDEFRGGH